MKVDFHSRTPARSSFYSPRGAQAWAVGREKLDAVLPHLAPESLVSADAENGLRSQ